MLVFIERLLQVKMQIRRRMSSLINLCIRYRLLSDNISRACIKTHFPRARIVWTCYALVLSLSHESPSPDRPPPDGDDITSILGPGQVCPKPAYGTNSSESRSNNT
ncbi:hypothetical protein DPMN_091828 [Dreissena polymorpha]|uniref:Uncharacterized protein n=1 Tax=Dreissena polymorpha TaxID=45954 RepID=A0A9D4L078_DREPO|nr:hypothetical protein DPMN_091828 [Dreissena polymorpha]